MFGGCGHGLFGFGFNVFMVLYIYSSINTTALIKLRHYVVICFALAVQSPLLLTKSRHRVAISVAIAVLFPYGMAALTGRNRPPSAASSRGTTIQPIDSAYARMRDWTVFCSEGVGMVFFAKFD